MIKIVKRALQGICIIVSGIAMSACGGASTNKATNNTGTGTGSAGIISLSAATYAVDQSAGTIAVMVDRTGGTTGAVSVAYATSDGTAVAGTDYTAAAGTLDWADGDAAAKSVSVPISTAPAFTGTKTITVTLSSATGGATTASPTAATITVTGSGTVASASGTLSLSAATYTVAQNAGALVVTVTRTGGSTGAVGISYSTTDGTATEGTDYTVIPGTLSWADGDAAAKTFSVTISNATPFVGSKGFMVSLSSPTGGATAGSPTSATVTINGTGVSSSPGVIALSASAYAVTQGATTLVVTANRTGGSTGAVSVTYATSNGTALAGTNYTAATGTLSWATGDTTAKTFAVTIATTPALTASKAFTVTLSAPTGGATLGTSTATATINVTGTSAVSVRVSGNHLIDSKGNILQLRGVDVSSLEFAAIDGSTDPWGGQKPNMTALASWKVNALRIPLNEASYLGYTCYDPPNATTHNPDPGANYKAAVKQIVADATALGWYIILDLHKNAPKGTINGQLYEIAPESTTQNQMADADNSVAFWTAIATDFKGSPNVIFDLFNEPYFDNVIAPSGVTSDVAWHILRDGGTNTIFYGGNTVFQQNWTSAGMQAMLTAVRNTGATNVVMTGGVSYAQDTSKWVTYKPTDPLNQLAMSWHAYPEFGTAYGTPAHLNPSFVDGYARANAVLAAGYPIIIGETGDQSSNCALPLSPFTTGLVTWADQNNVSVFGWSWNAWGSASADLISNANGTPTTCYGQVFHDWLVNHK